MLQSSFRCIDQMLQKPAAKSIHTAGFIAGPPSPHLGPQKNIGFLKTSPSPSSDKTEDIFMSNLILTKIIQNSWWKESA